MFAFRLLLRFVGRWLDAIAALDRVRVGDAVMHGLLIRGDRGAVRNPLLSIVRHEADLMRLIGAEFGLSPASRARVPAGSPSEDDGFDGLLA